MSDLEKYESHHSSGRNLNSEQAFVVHAIHYQFIQFSLMVSPSIHIFFKTYCFKPLVFQLYYHKYTF